MSKILSFCMICVLAFPGFAQISITSDDLFNLIGSPAQIINVDTLEETISVDIGSEGENQNWDFSGLAYPSEEFMYQYISPQGTLFEEDFSEANLTLLITMIADTQYFSLYEYWNVLSDSLLFLGNGIEFFGNTEIETWDEFAILPLTYGTTWNMQWEDTIAGFPFDIEKIESAEVSIDGWGSVTVPAGTYDCLRLRSDWIDIENTILDEVIIERDTTYGSSFSWLSKSSIELANINFEFVDGIPQYTEADEVSLLLEITAIGDIPVVERRFQLLQNYPNPFNPSTHIEFNLVYPQHVVLEVFDMLGQKVKTLLNKNMDGGLQSIDFDGSFLSSGIYYYTLQAGEFRDVKKMILLK